MKWLLNTFLYEKALVIVETARYDRISIFENLRTPAIRDRRIKEITEAADLQIGHVVSLTQSIGDLIVSSYLMMCMSDGRYNVHLLSPFPLAMHQMQTVIMVTVNDSHHLFMVQCVDRLFHFACSPSCYAKCVPEDDCRSMDVRVTSSDL